MKDWFKARNIWGGAFMALSDAEAGRLAKALWHFTMTGEEVELTGNEKAIYAMCLMTLRMDSDEDAALSAKRAAAGSNGGKQKVANVAIANNKNKNKEKEKEEDIVKETHLKVCKEKLRFSPPTVAEVKAYCDERRNNVDPIRFIDFYQAKGWMVGRNHMKDWKAAVRTWERSVSTVQVNDTASEEQFHLEWGGIA